MCAKKKCNFNCVRVLFKIPSFGFLCLACSQLKNVCVPFIHCLLMEVVYFFFYFSLFIYFVSFHLLLRHSITKDQENELNNVKRHISHTYSLDSRIVVAAFFLLCSCFFWCNFLLLQMTHKIIRSVTICAVCFVASISNEQKKTQRIRSSTKSLSFKVKIYCISLSGVSV